MGPVSGALALGGVRILHEARAMKVSTIMSSRPATIRAESSLDEAMQLMDERRLRHLPVLRDGRVVGMISDRDLLEATGWLPPRVRELLEAPSGCVGDFMHARPFTVGPDAKLGEVAKRLASEHLGCVPVLRDEALVGVVTETDLLRACVDRVARDGGDEPCIAEVMTPAPRVASPEDPVEEALDVLHAEDIRHLPVLEHGRLVGIVSDRDLRLAIGRGSAAGSRIRDVMTAKPATITADEGLSAAAALMVQEKISALPVESGGKLEGILTLADVLRRCAEVLGD